jgi:hypothetical protein
MRPRQRRLWADQVATQRLILQALCPGGLPPSFTDRVTVVAWVEGGGTPELPDLIEQAFDALAPAR